MTRIFKLQNLFILLTFSFVTLLIGCNTKPSDSLAFESFKNAVNDESNGALALVDEKYDFAKTNGYTQELAGQQTYVYEFGARLHAQKGFYKDENALMGGPFTNFRCAEQGSSFMNPIKFYKEARIGVQGQLTFVKKERGWELTEYKIKKNEIESNPNPLYGSWKLKQCPSDFMCCIDNIDVNSEVIVFYGNNLAIDKLVRYKWNGGESFSGIYEFSLGENGWRAHFNAKLSDDGQNLVISVPIPSEASKTILTFSKS